MTTTPLVAQICADKKKRRRRFPSQADMAKAADVSRRTLQYVKFVMEHGTPELQEACRQGKIKSSTGSEIARLSPEDQVEVVAFDWRRIVRVAKAIKQKRRELREESEP